MAGVFGAKYVVGLGLLVSSVLTLFIPLAAEAGVALLIVLRVIQGMSQVSRSLPSITGINYVLEGSDSSKSGKFPLGYGVNRSVLNVGQMGSPTGKESAHHHRCIR